jgi:CRISPR system Cascade subunit CasA
MINLNDGDLEGTDQDNDCPIWERNDPVSKPSKVGLPTGYLDFLTYQCRRILLVPETKNEKIIVRRVTIAPGLQLDNSYRDPMKHYVERTFGWSPMAFSENRMLWRDSHSLLQVHHPTKARPPKSFDWVHSLIYYGTLPDHKVCRFMALGMLAEKSKANIHFYRQEQMPLPFAYLNSETLVGQISDALSITEQVRSKLYLAVRRFAELMLSPSADLENGRKPDAEDVKKLMNYWAAERYYWSKLELPFLRLLEDLPKQSEAINTWQETVRKAAWNALEKVKNLAGDDTAALKAAVQARNSLAYSFSILFPQPEKETPQ